MIKTLTIENFKGFEDHCIQFNSFSVLSGRNNAGKSSAIEALRVVAYAIKRFLGRGQPGFKQCPPRIAGIGRGVVFSTDDVQLKPETIFHKYRNPPAAISAVFANGAVVSVSIGPDRSIFAQAFSPSGQLIEKRATDSELTQIAILPQISPLLEFETVLLAGYIEKHLNSHLTSRHFRNQIRYLPKHFDDFRDAFDRSWNGVRISSFDYPNARHGDELFLMLSEGGFVAEAAHFGHGLQMWLQIVWFLVRTEENNIVIFDEPDVYMHPDQQRKLLELVRGKFTQCILSTHATAILDECNEDEVIQLDRAVSKSVAGSRSKNDESKSNSHAQQVDGRVDADLAESWTIKIVVWDRESLVEIVDQHRKPVLCVYGEDSKGKPNEISIPQQPLSVRVHYPDNVDVFVDGDALDLGVFGDEFIVEFELAELVSNPSDH